MKVNSFVIIVMICCATQKTTKLKLNSNHDLTDLLIHFWWFSYITKNVHQCRWQHFWNFEDILKNGWVREGLLLDKIKGTWDTLMWVIIDFKFQQFSLLTLHLFKFENLLHYELYCDNMICTKKQFHLYNKNIINNSKDNNYANFGAIMG